MILVAKRPARPTIMLAVLAMSIAFLQPIPIAAQTSGIVMSDVGVHAVLSSNGTSQVFFSANVTNTGLNDIQSFDVRMDLRSLSIVSALVDGADANAGIIEGNTYSIVHIQPPAPLLPGESIHLLLEIQTSVLQEPLGTCGQSGFCHESMIYYVRPLNRYGGLTFKVTLPLHASLYTNTSSLFPRPTSNYTDGQSLIFVWKVGEILPGQEKVFIAKYDTPMAPTAVQDTGVSSLLWVIIAALGGIIGTIVVERLPNTLKTIRAPKNMTGQSMTDKEELVIRLLNKRGGSCPQREIYRELDMSQSLASMVLSGLEQRGIIKRMRDGRENIVHLIEV